MSTDNNESRKIVEDSPIMRSVALVAPPFMPMMRPLTPLKVPSAAVYEATSAKLHVTPLNKSPLPDWSEITCFPAFPTGYFLERTHVRIHDATPEEVLSRVSAILSHESVATRYDTNEVQIACESVDHVEFMVRFFQGEDACIIVEAQRSCGCSFSFHQLAKCVLRSAKGLSQSPCASKSLALPQSIPRSSAQEQMSCAMEGIEIAISLMKQGCLDAQLMALESLVQISLICNGSAAESILGNSEIRHFVLSFVEKKEDEMERSNECKLHRAAMTVIANCLDSLQKNDKLEQSLKAFGDSLLCDSILMSLLKEVSRGEQKPHEACQAIRVLQVFAQASTETRQRMKAHDTPVLVARVHEEGRHARLGELSHQFLRTWEH